MNNFETFENVFVKENRMLKILMGIGLFLSSLSVVLILSSRSYFIQSSGEIFKERPLVVDICREGLLSMSRGNPNELLFTKEVLEILEKEPFVFKMDELLKAESLESGACKIILKSEGKLLSFRLGLVEKTSFPFHFKIVQIDEQKISENDL